ncbi:MAG: homoserine kinase [Verrucomicrobiota bacterium]
MRIPATTSNLGPGFDCFGLALRIYNRIAVHASEGAPLTPMMQAAGDLFFERSAARHFPFVCSVRGAVPTARGLGSSVTVRLGLLHGLNELAGTGLNRHDLYELCGQLEGHPDNAAPASFGGFSIARQTSMQRWKVSQKLRAVLLIPDFEVATEEARHALPKEIDREAAVMSVGNAAAIAGAFASGDLENMRGCFRDGLHQPFRLKYVPFLEQVIAAAETAGALGAFLSGSGSTICALTLERSQEIADAMAAAAAPSLARVLVTTADNQGVQIPRPSR